MISAEERIALASKVLAKALIKIGETDELMRQYLSEVLGAAMADFHEASRQVDAVMADLK